MPGLYSGRHNACFVGTDAKLRATEGGLAAFSQGKLLLDEIACGKRDADFRGIMTIAYVKVLQAEKTSDGAEVLPAVTQVEIARTKTIDKSITHFVAAARIEYRIGAKPQRGASMGHGNALLSEQRRAYSAETSETT